MATNAVITDGTTGGTNINVVKVIVQTTENNDATINSVVNRGYITTLGTLQTINMPTPCIPGDVFYIQGKGAGLFHIAQRAGEQIILGEKSTVVGVAGYIESTNSNDNMGLICTDSAGIWVAMQGYVGTFDIDGTDTNNTINDTSGGSINLTSTGNNVEITGASPNINLDIGRVVTGFDAVAITNAAPVVQGNQSVTYGYNCATSGQGFSTVAMGNGAANLNQGNQSVAIGAICAGTNQGADSVSAGFAAGGQFQGLRCVAVGTNASDFMQGDDSVSVGDNAGNNSQGIQSVALGAKAGNAGQGATCVAVGYRAANVAQGAGSVAVGHDCAQAGIAADAIAFGRSCIGPAVDGRLAFGPHMEALTPIGATAAAQTGWVNLEHKGVHGRIPMFSGASDAEISGGGAARSYGEIYKTPNVNDTQFIGVIWAPWLVGTFFAGPLADFTWDDPTNKTRLIYTGAGGVFNLRFNFATEDGSPQDFNGAIYLNGVRIEKSIFWFRNTSETAMTSSGYAKIALATNDYIEPWLIAVTGGASLTAKTLTLDANQV